MVAIEKKKRKRKTCNVVDSDELQSYVKATKEMPVLE